MTSAADPRDIVEVRITLALALLVVACGTDAEPPTARTERARPEPPAAPSCDAASPTWGVPEYDALEGLNDPSVVRPGGRGRDTLAARLSAAAAVQPPEWLSPAARVTLQNDVWGVLQRARSAEVSSPELHAIAVAAGHLVRRLAPRSLERWSPGFPSAVAPVLEGGWQEHESELPSLQHERLFGFRRVFHVARRGEDERALFSTLVAIDRDGAPVLTRYVGDLEMLRFEDGELVEARVFELDRRAVRCRGAASALREVDDVAQVPGIGAHSFLRTFDPPADLDTLPCARCHDNVFPMSLPSTELEVGGRFDVLLRVPREDAEHMTEPAAQESAR